MTIPSENFICDPVPLGLCQTVDNSLTKDEIIARVNRIRKRVVRAIGTCGLEIARGERILRRANRLRRRIVRSNINNLPDESLVCSE